MVTRRVIRISPKAEAPPPAPAANAPSEAAIVAVEPAKKEKPKVPLCNHASCTRRAQHPSPLCWRHGAQDVECKFSGCDKRGVLSGLCPDHGGLVQLCRWRGCINKANLEKRGGLCWMHRSRGKHDDESSSEEEEEEEDIRLCRYRGCISVATADEELCDRHSWLKRENNRMGSNKRAHPSESDYDTRKRQKPNDITIDLEDVPPQPPIPKSAGYIKDGASKYTGVHFLKQQNKWQANISINGKRHFIGCYDNEEEAAVDYARALFKYKGCGALDNAMEQRSHRIDLSNVPPQPPIPKSAGHIKDGASKYTGVHFLKQQNKWQAQIMIDGKHHYIGCYNNEEEAAVDYARALFKYGERRQQRQRASTVDLTDVPPQPPIPKSAGRIKDGASKYTGVHFFKQQNKWQASIMIDGKRHFMGYYDNEEEAAVDYARALFKYGERRQQRQRDSTVDLTDVPPQPPIPRNAGRIKNGASKYTGVSFHKQHNKWQAQISIDGKKHSIGSYDNEEEAAVDYARALFKYKGRGALDKAMKQHSLKHDLSNVHPQPLIPKSAGRIKDGASKYTGVHFLKQQNKWQARIMIDGKQHSIGCYDNEEEAAVDYARVLFKYGERRQQRQRDSTVDLTDVPPQPPIPKSAGRIKDGASKYTGVHFFKQQNKWQASIMIDGKQHFIGCYDNEEEAAVDYARALFKYGERRQQRQRDSTVDLTDVPPQPPTVE